MVQLFFSDSPTAVVVFQTYFFAPCAHAQERLNFNTFAFMQGKSFFALVLPLIVAMLSACSTEVDVNAPYDSRTVVFGLLEPTLDTQFVKINRTWLGDANNFDVAQMRDSSEYPTGAFEGTLEVLNGNNVVQTFPINEIELSDKSDDGIFFAPEHKAYYFVTPGGLNSNRDYRLKLVFPDREVEAVTDVIPPIVGSIQFPPAGANTFQMNWASVTPNGTTYNNPTFRWNTSPNARRYEATLLIYMTERVWSDLVHTNLVEERLRVLEWNLGRAVTNNLTGGETINLPTNGQSFYRFLQSRLQADPFVTREFGIWDSQVQFSRCFDFVLAIANDDFNTYMNVNEPVTNIIQERPQFTNVSNGLGLWASRSSDAVLGFGISEGSIRELVLGQFTQDLNFCSSNPFNQYYCNQ